MLRVRVLALILAPMLVLVAVVAATSYVESRVRENAEAARRSETSLVAAMRLLSAVVDAETGMRGFLETGRPVFLQPFDDAERSMPRLRAELLAADGEPEAVAIGDGATHELAAFAALIREVRSGHGSTAIASLAQSKVGVDAYRAVLGSYERRVVRHRDAELGALDALWRAESAGALVATASTVALSLVLAIVFWRTVAQRLSAVEQLARRVGAGEPLGKETGGADEIASIERAIRGMATELRARQSVLARYRLLSEVTRDVILFYDRNTLEIIEANTAAETAYGFARADLIGMPITALRAEEIREADVVAMDSPGGATFEIEHRRSDGTTFPIEAVVRGTDIDGRRIIVCTIRDITERRRAQVDLMRALDDAVEAARAKSEFLATMSHEIRTPMNAVIGMSELLVRSAVDEGQREYAQTIRDSGRSLLAILDDILDFSKAEAGKMLIERVVVSPAGIARSVVALFEQAATAKGVTIAADISPSVPEYVYADPVRVRQVLANLLSNAVKFTTSGSVRIGVRVAKDRGTTIDLRFSVTDTGVGIAPETLARLFQPFVQADGSTTRQFGGTGLGLTISHRLVELMGGHFDVDSRPGEGSTFTFVIPVQVAASADLANAAGDFTFNGQRLLVIEHDDEHREVALRYAAAWGLEASAVTSGARAETALAQAATEGRAFDVVLLPDVLQGADATAVAHRIRLLPEYGTPAIIMTSAFDDPARRARAATAGFAAYAVKPFGPSSLHEALLRAFEYRRDVTVTTSDARIERARPARLLMAEDHPINRRVATLQFRQLGYEIEMVGDGGAAINAAFEQRYDLIFMDLHMPGVDGLKATRAIREAEAELGRHVTIVALTANALEGDRRRCLDAGMDDYLSKPLEIERLQEVLERWLPGGVGHAC